MGEYTRPGTVKIRAVCRDCDGQGVREFRRNGPAVGGDWNECLHCGGSGIVEVLVPEDEVTRLVEDATKELRDAVLAIHERVLGDEGRPDRGYVCNECCLVWPCATARAVGG